MNIGYLHIIDNYPEAQTPSLQSSSSARLVAEAVACTPDVAVNQKAHPRKNDLESG